MLKPGINININNWGRSFTAIVIYVLSSGWRQLGGTNVGVVGIRMFHVNFCLVPAITQINPSPRG
jgi:hypothetical protein